MSKSLGIALFLALLLVGVAFGVARDLYSYERGQLTGDVVEVIRGERDNKSFAVRTPRLHVRLADGRTVYVAVTEPQLFKTGDTISLSEMVMPWGQVWYKLKQG
ncbi:MAG: hypothetical protein WBP38_04885 [Hyphomicrobium sp.]|mgnify:CR=1 FL=1|nr:hypothetical protein [Hyphomicrobium sp.]